MSKIIAGNYCNCLHSGSATTKYYTHSLRQCVLCGEGSVSKSTTLTSVKKVMVKATTRRTIAIGGNAKRYQQYILCPVNRGTPRK